MKKVNYLLFLLLPLAAVSQEEGIHFEHGQSWKEIKAKAQAENKYIFMDCYATWCGPCKMMDKNIFTQAPVGEFFNKNFINVKVQVDTSKKDNEEIISWYADAHDIATQNGVQVLPTFFVYNPNGELVHRIDGSNNNADLFMAQVSEGLDTTKQYYTLAKKYNNGNREPELMRNLIDAMIRAGDGSALMVCSEYLATQTNMFTPTNIDIIKKFTSGSGTNGFSFFYNNSDKVDSVMGKGTADRVVMPIIQQEDLYSKLAGPMPNWDSVREQILVKYPAKKTQINEMVAAAKIMFYQNTGNYKMVADAVTAYLKDYGYKATPEQLNSIAWDVFNSSKDPAVLNKALAWSKQSFATNNDPMYMDTYANILYKLGRKKEALVLQQKALSLANELDKPALIETITKMKKGVKTWQ